MQGFHGDCRQGVLECRTKLFMFRLSAYLHKLLRLGLGLGLVLGVGLELGLGLGLGLELELELGLDEVFVFDSKS